MSIVNSDPLFVRAEVAYRLERFGVAGAGTHTDTGPSLIGALRRWSARRHPARPVRAARGARVTGRPRHP